MNIDGIIWLRDIINKLNSKHNVKTNEVEQVLNNKPKFVLSKEEIENVKMYTWL